MKASALDWGRDVTHRISPNEFPAGVLDHMDAQVILVLSDLREDVGLPLMPSPIYGAHVRQTGGSRHSIDGGSRLSDATDFFCSWGAAWKYLDAARRHPQIGGIGIYTDMLFNPRGLTPNEGDWAMIHIDLRPAHLEWVGWREDRSKPTQYIYLARSPLDYYKTLAERGRAG